MTVTAGNDADGDNDTATLSHTASGPDEYGGEKKELPVTVADNDAPGVTVSPAAVTVGEGATATVTAVLNTKPSADVAVTIVDPTDNTEVTLNPASLTFTKDNWNTAQTVTVAAAHDNDAAEDAATVTHTTASTDASYDGLAVSNADITVTDDDTAGVTVSPKKISIIAGRTNSYTMKLTAQPTASVTTTITIPADAEITLDKSSLTFTTTTCNTAQKITVTAADNAARAQVTLTHTVSGGDYGTVTADDMTVKVLPPPSTQTIQVGVTTGAQSLAVPEGGTAKYSLVLSSEPSADATITATLPTGNDLSLDKTTLTFAEDNWDTAQELTLSAAEDADTVTDPRDRPA